MRFHLLAQASNQTTKEFGHNGFNQNVMWFSRMLKEMGHTVFLYASEENDTPCDELITCITRDRQEDFKNKAEKTGQESHLTSMWRHHNKRAIKEIAKRKLPKDFICSIGGKNQKLVSDAHPDLIFVEYSVGYHNSWSPFRVFESQAMRHLTMGLEKTIHGSPWHQVIYNFFDPDMFHIGKKEPYALYLGRLNNWKGINMAGGLAKRLNIDLKIIGTGDTANITFGEYLGPVSQAHKLEVLSKASVLLAPVIYAEPFGSACVEAQLSGTPVVATDWGAYTETVEQGVTGYRCNSLAEYAYALTETMSWTNHQEIRDRAISRFSIEAAKPQYQDYFDRLLLRWGV